MGAPQRLSGPGMIGSLIDVARANPGGRWQAGTDIARARNAHVTNTAGELRTALSGPFDWLECDVRVRGGVLVTAHGSHDRRALHLRDWLRIAVASGRGIKLDVKEATALTALLYLVRESGADQASVIVNVPAGNGAAARRIRSVLPDCIVNLDPGPAPYTAAALERVAAVARSIGGQVMVPLDAQHVTPEVVRLARRAGRVAIWNDPRRFDPGPVDAATKRLRAMGVDGMVDLRRPVGSSSLVR